MNEATLQKIRADISQLNALGEDSQLTLPAYGSWPATIHQFDVDSLNILKTALAAQRPILLRGDPGTGKSQLAHAAAAALGRLFVYEVVNSHTDGQDLLWKFDAVGRLAEAQALQANTGENERRDILNTRRYTAPGVMWWALCCDSALETYENSQYQLSKPEQPDGWCQADGSVILIDEIDKANAELPNSLLEILGNNAVEIPCLGKTIGGDGSTPPLVIITTNEERELPPAFVRRCLVLNLDLPKDEQELQAFLVRRGSLHFGTQCQPTVLTKAAEQLARDRQLAQEKGVTPPGQAEYLDMLRALAILGQDEGVQLDMLRQIHKFVLRKYPVMYE